MKIVSKTRARPIKERRQGRVRCTFASWFEEFGEADAEDVGWRRGIWGGHGSLRGDSEDYNERREVEELAQKQGAKGSHL